MENEKSIVSRTNNLKNLSKLVPQKVFLGYLFSSLWGKIKGGDVVSINFENSEWEGRRSYGFGCRN